MWVTYRFLEARVSQALWMFNGLLVSRVANFLIAVSVCSTCDLFSMFGFCIIRRCNLQKVYMVFLDEFKF